MSARRGLPLSPLDAMTDARLWRSTFGGPSWGPWRTFVAAANGEPITDAADVALLRACTGRETAPTRPARTVVALCGRRSGKSLVAAALATAHAVLARPTLAPGEQPVVLVCAVDKRQAKVLHGYIAGLLDASPLTRAEVVGRTAERIELRSGVSIEIRASDYRRVRGVTCLAAVVDEAAFLRSEDSSTPDVELWRAVRPSLVTTGGPFIAISTAYAKRGLLYSLWRKHWGSDVGDALVWVAPSTTMNPTLDAAVIDEALRDDPAGARSEWLSAWREDVEVFLSEAALEAVTMPGRHGLPPVAGRRYVAFLDPSGGSQDAFALAIAHTEDRDGQAVAVVDHLDEVRPPFNAEDAVCRFAATLAAFKLSEAIADRFGGVWVAEAFRRHGAVIEQAAEPKSTLYSAFLPLVTARRVELIDHERMRVQLASLERRVRAGGRDVVDHPPGAHDDLANVVAGACVLAAADVGRDAAPVARNLGPLRVRLDLGEMDGL